MGCFGDRERGVVRDEQRWDYITLSDFKSTSFWTPFTYGWLLFLAIVAVAVYAADTYTAVVLLVYNRWSSEIQPAIPYNVSRWIFAICIILSWVLCGFEWIRAIRVIRRGSVAESYLDPLAVILQSLRMGSNGRGWRRFLVFTELTKSRKGVDYIALFVYFQFKGAIRIIVAESPRQVINALTLYSILNADLIPEGKNAATHGHSSFEQFFINVQVLAQTNREQAIIIFTMLFTLVIWVISALSLITATVLYLLFLWHYIPQSDGRLSRYCRRKVDRRLEQVVGVKVREALEEQERKRQKEEQGSGGRLLRRQPTLPVLPGNTDDKKPSVATISVESTHSSFSSHPETWQPHEAQMSGPRRQPTLPDVAFSQARPLAPSRSGTQMSTPSVNSYGSGGPLLGDAAPMGVIPPQRIHSQSNQGQFANERGQPTSIQSMPGRSVSFHRPFPAVVRPPTAQSNTPMRQNSGATVVSPPSRQGTVSTIMSQSTLGPSAFITTAPYDNRMPALLPAPVYETRSQTPSSLQPPSTAEASHYVAFNPGMHTRPSEPTRSGFAWPAPVLHDPRPPRRNYTDTARAVPPLTKYSDPQVPQRAGTAPPLLSTYDDFVNGASISGPLQPRPVPRAATAGPFTRSERAAPGVPPLNQLNV